MLPGRHAFRSVHHHNIGRTVVRRPDGLVPQADAQLVGRVKQDAVRRLLPLFAVASLAGMLSLVSYPERFKSYREERYGSFGADEFGISLDYRVLPVSSSRPAPSCRSSGISRPPA